MAIPVLENYFRSYNNTATTSVSATLSGIQSGDLLIALVCSATVKSFETLSVSGYTQYHEDTFGSINAAGIFWKKATGSETICTGTCTQSDEMAIMVLRISGADTEDPFEATRVLNYTTPAASFITNIGITTGEDNTLAIGAFLGKADAGFSTASGLTGHPPWVFIDDANPSGSAGDAQVVASEQDMATAGSTGNVGWNMSAGFTGVEYTFNIREGTDRRINIT
jgi:hypothetical protein